MLNNLLYGKQRSEFKKLLEETVIPEVMSYEEREPLLKPLLEYVHSITPAKLFRYRDCSEIQFDAFYNDRIYAGNDQKFNPTLTPKTFFNKFSACFSVLHPYNSMILNDGILKSPLWMPL